jgi:hypothetical protein
MVAKTAFTQERTARGVLIKPRRAADSDDVLTAAEAKKIRSALKQVREGKTKSLTRIKNELGL